MDGLLKMSKHDDNIHFLCQYLSKILAAEKYQVVIMILAVNTYQPSSIATLSCSRGPNTTQTWDMHRSYA